METDSNSSVTGPAVGADPNGFDRRQALRAALGGAAAAAVFAAPRVEGFSITPTYASAASSQPPITATGTATKSGGLGCFSGAGGDDQFLVTLGDGWWHFYFQGCSLGSSESVALADPPGGPSANAYKAPTNYHCRMELLNGTTPVYDTGWVSDPINGIADTGGLIFIGTSAYPNGYGDMNWRITCETF